MVYGMVFSPLSDKEKFSKMEFAGNFLLGNIILILLVILYLHTEYYVIILCFICHVYS